MRNTEQFKDTLFARLHSLLLEGLDLKVIQGKMGGRVNIRFGDKNLTLNYKGFFREDNNVIYLFPRNAEDDDDFDKTIVHEFLHSVYPIFSETKIEEETDEIRRSVPGFLQVLKSLYNIKTREQYINDRNI